MTCWNYASGNLSNRIDQRDLRNRLQSSIQGKYSMKCEVIELRVRLEILSGLLGYQMLFQLVSLMWTILS